MKVRRKIDSSTKRSHEPEHSPGQETENTVLVELDSMVDEFLIRTRRLLLFGTIDEVMSAQICSYLQLLALTDDPIYMYINSPGGCMSSGYAIIDQMLVCGCPVHTVVRGCAHSMAGIIAAYGDKGCRHATPNSSLMLHSLIISSPPDFIEKHVIGIDYIKKDYDRKVCDLASRLKIRPKKLAELLRDTKWMSPEQAIKIGLIDSLWTPQMEQKVDRSFSYDDT